MRCVCETLIEFGRPGADVGCGKCGAEFNSSGQLLAPRSQWGEETGETDADYDAGFANPERAFDGN